MRTNIAIVVIVSASLGVVLWMVYLAAAVAIKIAVALIAVTGGFITAIINHTLQLEKDRASHAQQLEEGRIEAERRAKQENYKDLLSKVGAFARQLPSSADELTSAHLASWAFGDLDVLIATNRFQRTRDRASLLELLAAIRLSLQSDSLPDYRMKEYDSTVLFPPEQVVQVQKGLG
jgi:hypothetical protein